MSELVTRISLNNDNFNKNLEQSKSKVKDFKGSISDASSVLAKWGSAIAGAGTVLETFNRFINSTQEYSDQFNNTIGAAKATVDQFFISLNTGNFTAFSEGLTDVINKMYEIQQLRDSLGDAKLSVGYLDTRTESEFKQLEAIYKDPTKSLAERRKALNDAKTLINDFGSEIQSTIKGNVNVIQKELSAARPDLNWTMEDIDSYLRYGNNDFSQNPMAVAFQKFKSKMADLKKHQYAEGNIQTSFGIISTSRENKTVTKQIKDLEAENPLFAKWLYLNNQNDESRQQLLADMQYDYMQNGRLAQMKTRLIKGEKMLASAFGKIDKGESKKIIPSFAKEPIPLEIEYDVKVTDIQEPDLTDFIDRDEQKLERQRQQMIKTYVSPLEQAQEQLGDLSNMFGSLGNAIGGSGGAALNFFGAVMSGTSELIPQIKALIDAKHAEAMASGTASAAKLPFPASLGAIVSIIATIASIFASLPKFANGGVFTGNSTIGDLNIARVNSGEMILNNRQQRQLFKILNNSGVLNSPNTSKVQFVIEGKQLVGVLKNYNNKVNKVI